MNLTIVINCVGILVRFELLYNLYRDIMPRQDFERSTLSISVKPVVVVPYVVERSHFYTAILFARVPYIL